MFQYTVAVKVKNPSHRGASMTIKTQEDLDIRSKTATQRFVDSHNVVPFMEKMFGTGCVKEWYIVDKTPAMQRA